ncbi:hypothetical protein LJC46_01270 [Desulfovibrio sp. OttesenSCG-928-G15]|nr:hypothetical protein [Desulfovibrio sp. OttesenSCG-928-G15]
MTDTRSPERCSYPDWSTLEPLQKDSPESRQAQSLPFGLRPGDCPPCRPEEEAQETDSSQPQAAPEHSPSQPDAGVAPARQRLQAAPAGLPARTAPASPLARFLDRFKRKTPPSRRPLPVLFRVWQAQALFATFGAAIFSYFLYTQNQALFTESMMACLLVLMFAIPAIVLIELMQRYSALLAIGVSLISGGVLAFYSDYSLALRPEVLERLLAASALVLGALSLLALIVSRWRMRFSVAFARELTCLYCPPLSAALFWLWQRDKSVLQPFMQENRWTWTHLASQSAETISAWFASAPLALFLCIVGAMALQLLFYTYLSLSKDRLNAYFA